MTEARCVIYQILKRISTQIGSSVVMDGRAMFVMVMEWKGVGIDHEQEKLQCSKRQGRRERRLLPQTSGGESVRSNSEVGYVGDVL